MRICLGWQGSGLSDGNWVTLGAHEVEDLETVVSHLRKVYPESAIGLWGRSMGAVTALMYSQRDPSIAGVVSSPPPPFCSPDGNSSSSFYIPGMETPHLILVRPSQIL